MVDEHYLTDAVVEAAGEPSPDEVAPTEDAKDAIVVPLGAPRRGERLGGEAPFVAWWKMYNGEGHEVSVTVRAGDAEAMVERVGLARAAFEEMGYGYKRVTAAVTAQAQRQPVAKSSPAAASAAPVPNAPGKGTPAVKKVGGDLIAQIELMEVRRTKAGKPYLRMKLANGQWASAFDGLPVDAGQMQEGVQYAPPDEFPFVAVRKNKRGYLNVVAWLRPDEVP